MQISDSHMGFNKPRIPMWSPRCKPRCRRSMRCPSAPEFILHTGDISHLSKPAEFDTVDQILNQRRPRTCFSFPASTTCWKTTASSIASVTARTHKGAGWYSFDKKGVHFIGLVNVMNLKAGGMGSLGTEQLEWLEDDVKHLSKSTPIVVFAHMPLWSIYPEWGWGTDDSAQALSYLKRFGSVTVLNGHIHQTMQKVEGNVTFPHRDFDGIPATASGSGAFAGADESSGRAVAQPAGSDRRELTCKERHALAVIDSTLE